MQCGCERLCPDGWGEVRPATCVASAEAKGHRATEGSQPGLVSDRRCRLDLPRYALANGYYQFFGTQDFVT